MTNNSQAHVTLILQELVEGDATRMNELIPIIYEELHRRAKRQLQGERAEHTLNPTALVHEAYLKLVETKDAHFHNRTHFFALASQAMRRILVDYARARQSQKRGGDHQKITLVDHQLVQELPSDDIVALDDSLGRLSSLNERQARVVEYWFFGGLTHEEIAVVLNISLPSVRRDWRLARAWLSRELKQTVSAQS